MRLFWRKKKKERFNQKLIHVAKIQHLIHQSKIVINAVVIRSAFITEGVITTCCVIGSAVLVNNSVDMCEFYFRRKASYAVYF